MRKPRWCHVRGGLEADRSELRKRERGDLGHGGAMRAQMLGGAGNGRRMAPDGTGWCQVVPPRRNRVPGNTSRTASTAARVLPVPARWRPVRWVPKTAWDLGRKRPPRRRAGAAPFGPPHVRVRNPMQEYANGASRSALKPGWEIPLVVKTPAGERPFSALNHDCRPGDIHYAPVHRWFCVTTDHRSDRSGDETVGACDMSGANRLIGGRPRSHRRRGDGRARSGDAHRPSCSKRFRCPSR